MVSATALDTGAVLSERGVAGVWRHRAMLPHTDHAVTLGEAATPLLELDRRAQGELPDGIEVFAKLESLNPTLSFKDRAMALAASAALDLGLQGFVLASTGNAAVSAAAYAAAAGLACRIVCGRGSGAVQKLAIARAHGAEVEVVDGDYSTAYQAAAARESEGWLNVTTTYRNPLLAEAYRGVAVELVEDLGGAPSMVVVPVGAGPLLFGMDRGFDDLERLGLIADRPRMVGVQADACAPLARAWESGRWLESLREPMVPRPTRATAIADALRGYEAEGLLTLGAASVSGGRIVAVTEDAMLEATERLARSGIFVEPAAGAAVAALPRVVDADTAGPVVVMLTGHGAKEAAPA